MKLKASYTIVQSSQEKQQQRLEMLKEHALNIYHTFCKTRKVSPRSVKGYSFNSSQDICYLSGRDKEVFAKVDLLKNFIFFN